ncbi:MAG: cation-transporting P-type ATPase, partial [Candidatus Falkowbacteria bacterium]|nr:cation-transporting P-type ATPase [Candidatus Falkowbacteria bacterium]
MNEKNKNHEWHNMSTREVARHYKVDIKNGLTRSEVEKRVKFFGHNNLPAPAQFTALQVLIGQSNGPLAVFLFFKQKILRVEDNLFLKFGLTFTPLWCATSLLETWFLSFFL